MPATIAAFVDIFYMTDRANFYRVTGSLDSPIFANQYILPEVGSQKYSQDHPRPFLTGEQLLYVVKLNA